MAEAVRKLHVNGGQDGHFLHLATDLQYAVLQENLDKLTKQSDHSVESVNRFSAEIALLSESLTNQKADAIQQLGLLSSRLTASVSESGQRADKADAAIRKSRRRQDATTLRHAMESAHGQQRNRAGHPTHRNALCAHGRATTTIANLF